MKRFFVNSRGLTVFRTVFQTANASPYRPVSVMRSPATSPISCTAFAAYKELCQRVFTVISALFGNSIRTHTSFGITASDLLLHYIKSVFVLYSFFGYFLSFSVLLFLTAFVSALKTPFGAFESYFYGLGFTVTLNKSRPFSTQKTPENREFFAWDLFCNIDMVPLTGLEPVRYCYRGILSPLCLPIPPQRQFTSM